MAHGHGSIGVSDVPEIAQAAPVELPRSTRYVLWALVAIGVASFVLSVTGEHPKLAWVSLQVNFTYWFMISTAASGFAAVFHIANGQWARPIRRAFEATSNFPLILIGVFIFSYLGHDQLFVWAHEAMPGRGMWLTSRFVYVRDVFAMICLVLLVRRVVQYTLREDIGVLRSGLVSVKSDALSRWRDKSLDCYVEGWGADVSAELAQCHERKSRLSPIVVIFFAIALSLVAFDQIMSVDPHWYSTLFGAFYFMSGVYGGIAWVAIIVALLRELHPLFRARVGPNVLHDLGKLLFGFGIFWAYLFWSHYLTIWYGNIPEETKWVITRLRLEPWHGLAWLTFGCCFIVPFLVGLSLSVKKVPGLLFALGAIVSCGLWLQQYLLFAPTLYPQEIPLSVMDILISLGFMGAFLLSVFSFLKKVPAIPFGDLYAGQVLQKKKAA